MSRPVLLGVELIEVTGEDGVTRLVPDIGEALRDAFHKTAPKTHTASWGEHALTVYSIGLFSGKRWFFGDGTRKIFVKLAHLGMNIKLLADLTPVQRDAILAKGFRPIRRVSDNAIVGILPPVVIAGDEPISVGIDGQFDEDEEYYHA